MGGFMGRIRGTSMGERRKDKRRREKADAATQAQRKPLRVSTAAQPFLLAILSALLLTLAFPPTEISWLAYLAPVPLLVMAVATAPRRHVFRAAWLGGLVFFGWNIWWIWPISLPGTAAGWAALVAYLGLYWAVFAWGLRRIKEAFSVPLTLAAPVLWVGLEYVRGWLISGLPWIYVGHTQYENLVLVQTADALGAYGPSFLVLMTAGLAADGLTRPLFACGADGARRRFGRVLPAMAVLVACAWAATVGYGVWRLGQRTDRPGPVVASVQTNIPQELKNAARLGSRGAAESTEEPAPVPREEAEKLADGFLAQSFKDLLASPFDANVKAMAERLVDDTQKGLREELVRRLVEGRVTKGEAEESAQFVADELRMMLSLVRLTGEALASARSAGTPPDLVVWPETMVPVPMNPGFLTADLADLLRYRGLVAHFAFLQERSRRYGRLIRELGALVPSPVLIGASGLHVLGVRYLEGDRVTCRAQHTNEALLVVPDSPVETAAGEYAKAHLVPFGEYVPFKESWPWLHECLNAFTPYRGMEYSLTPGAHDQEPFSLAFDGGEARFQAAICYEDAMAYRVREMVRPRAEAGRKAVDFIVNISNDGWFAGSVELDQHLNLCVFRAIENRVPVVRSVNTGISALIASDGRIEAVAQDAEGRRRSIEGFVVGRIALDDRLSPYTRVGDVFALACVGASAFGGVLVLVASLRSRKEAKP
ncbi:MAG TPA: apolipoprotein N-acyltransferase [Phycisphaerae bacterium]|nr:apolipoprotein N-acyltransferase [Phycisphaerae bacterium]